MIAKIKRSLWVGIISVLTLGIFMVPATDAQAQEIPGGNEKVTICHRTSADENSENPYNKITVDINGVGNNGLGDHYDKHNDNPGVVIYNAQIHEQMKGEHKKWGDIIPPTSVHPEGLNWTTQGQAVWNSNCMYPEVPQTLVAAASVTILPATCTTGQKLVYGEQNNATVKAGSTADGTVGPTTYSVTFVANANASFENNAKELVVQGSLTGALTEPRCETGQVLGGTSGGSGSATGTPASLPNTSGEASIVATVAGSLLAIVIGFAGASRLLSRSL